MAEIPPQAQLGEMITGYWTSQAIYAAAKFGIADLLAEGPKPVDELAATTGTKSDLLYRLLRALASVGKDKTENFLRSEQKSKVLVL